jgi:hypothetical protein
MSSSALGEPAGTGTPQRGPPPPPVHWLQTPPLCDFDNKTGDPVFDDTLKQALAVDLGQSPFLNMLSDRKVAATLRLMSRSPDQPVMGEVARELCQRVGSKAMLAGSISALGNNYVIGLNAINCATGDALVKQQVEARGKENVLTALGNAASDVRGKLGRVPETQDLRRKVLFWSLQFQPMPLLKRAAPFDDPDWIFAVSRQEHIN